LLIFMLIVIYTLGIALVIPSLLIPVAMAIPFALCLAVFWIAGLLRSGTAQLPPLISITGVAFIIGGGLFDITATVIHSPTLVAEANPIARAFLDSGYPLWFLYLFASLSQALLLLFTSLAWLAFLRHRQQLVCAMGQPRKMQDLVRAMVGAGHLPKRKWWQFPTHRSDLPCAYHLLWLLVVLLVGSSLDRWWLGLEWFQLVPSIRGTVTIIAVLATQLVYLAWLWHWSRHTQVPA